MREVGGDEFVNRRQPDGAQPAAVEHETQRFRLAVADDQNGRTIAGRLLKTIENPEMTGTGIRSRCCHEVLLCPYDLWLCLFGAVANVSMISRCRVCNSARRRNRASGPSRHASRVRVGRTYPTDREDPR
ncbi:hypothetical protein Ate02nite_58650 [Paractinoplanes tereljensis]|uniref:Uncharacterized protein n=1 Tax=Paractinoplanes tereljensis TaxID=571912 RepID=A0A919TWC1_9ACTN|nr:hypothetical protein Ate02nite_58650 [Actinoplanes tereljensis]